MVVRLDDDVKEGTWNDQLLFFMRGRAAGGLAAIDQAESLHLHYTTLHFRNKSCP